MSSNKKILSAIDIPGSGWAKHYLTRPYGNYKHEVYPLVIDILSTLPARSKILDVGAGPGHLSYEFFLKHRTSDFTFSLVDASSELLKYANDRLKFKSNQLEIYHRSYLEKDWSKGLGKFNAVVSTNAPFTTNIKDLTRFLGTIYRHIRIGGILVYLYPFGYGFEDKAAYAHSPIADFMNQLPGSVLPEYPKMTKTQSATFEREKVAAVAKHTRALSEFTKSGAKLPIEPAGWQPISMQKHLKLLHDVGFQADCIWKKCRYGVILGIKQSKKNC